MNGAFDLETRNMYTHHRVDEVKTKTLRKATPFLFADGKFDYLGSPDDLSRKING